MDVFMTINFMHKSPAVFMYIYLEVCDSVMCYYFFTYYMIIIPTLVNNAPLTFRIIDNSTRTLEKNSN